MDSEWNKGLIECRRYFNQTVEVGRRVVILSDDSHDHDGGNDDDGNDGDVNDDDGGNVIQDSMTALDFEEFIYANK